MAESHQDLELFKFPRTRHLFDAGGSGVSRDDLLMDKAEENSFYTPSQGGRVGRGGGGGGAPQQVIVALEEKVDGANLGISIGSDMQLKVQNRSHYVNSKTHRQFSILDSWLSEHSSSLYEVLEPERHVLFGEWLYARHSIHYTKLPGYFMAFDLYDRQAGKFYSWRERNRRLKDTDIPIVRQIAETTLKGRDEVRKLLDTKSAFYDGPCEGVYIRIDEDMPGGSGNPYLSRRAKVVRPDFLQGIEEEWTKQKFTKNIVIF